MKTEEILKKVAAVPFWWHSIQFTPEIAAKGHKTPEILAKELETLRFPSLAGKTVLDIGAWDGFYSFWAEKMGAKKVVALDHYVWSIDWKKAKEQEEESKRTGVKSSHDENFRRVWKPESLPGKIGFDTAREILQSKVESVVADFMTADLKSIGQFDVVFFLGVLYHMQNPLESLKRLAQLTKEMAIIETEAILLPGFEGYPFAEFYETDECAGDPSNWWAPTMKSITGMCRAAGFSRAEPVVFPPMVPNPFAPKASLKRWVKKIMGREVKIEPVHYRAIVHAFR